MKNKILMMGLVCVSAAMTSCDDFLDQTNTYQANPETFYDTDEAVSYATAPLYNYVWNDFNGKFYYSVGDGRSNNLTARWSDYIYPYTNFTETANSPGLEDAWGAFYSVVSQSNNAINAISKNCGPAVTDGAKIQGLAEARFMRGLAFWYLGSVWGKAIIYTDTQEAARNVVRPTNRLEDVIEFAIRDMEFAAANLAKTQANPGRVTCYSAYGMLSRFYLSMAGLTTEGAYDGNNIATDHNRGSRNPYYLDLAAKAALKCMEGPYSLMPDYGDLFTVSKWNNNQESVFQLQWLQGSTDAVGWGGANSISAFFSWSTMVGETNWGNATYASYDMVRTYKPEDFAVRRHYTIATNGDFYPQLNVKNGGYTYNVTETGYDNKCNVVKHVIGKLDDNGQSYQQSSGLNTYMMRLAEVYLNYTEAKMGNAGTLSGDELKYFNMVRRRAKVSEKSSINYSDLIYERRVELAYEGLYWYDLLRRSYYQEEEVIGYLNSQERNAGYEWDTAEACQYAKTSDGTGVSTATKQHLTFPVSNVDLTRNPKLKDTPVAYEFGEKEVETSSLFN